MRRLSKKAFCKRCLCEVSNLKNWKSLDEQLEILVNRGIGIEDEPSAKAALQRYGYYRISGYFYPFRKLDGDTILDDFEEGTEFSNIIALYEFDRNLRLLALDAMERIEVRLQTDLAYLLGRYDPCAHRKEVFFDGRFVTRKLSSGNTRFEEWQERFDGLVNRSSNKAFVKHNLSNYGEMPIWVAILIWDFGTLSHLFAGMKNGDQTKIAANYGLPSGKYLKEWIRSFSYIRNISAHQERLWNNSISDISSVPPHLLNLKPLNAHKPFLYFCLMQKLLKVINPDSNWGDKFIVLMDNFPEPANQKVSLADFGIVDNWKEFAEWQ